jgi:hypothetical protein
MASPRAFVPRRPTAAVCSCGSGRNQRSQSIATATAPRSSSSESTCAATTAAAAPRPAAVHSLRKEPAVGAGAVCARKVLRISRLSNHNAPLLRHQVTKGSLQPRRHARSSKGGLWGLPGHSLRRRPRTDIQYKQARAHHLAACTHGCFTSKAVYNCLLLLLTFTLPQQSQLGPSCDLRASSLHYRAHHLRPLRFPAELDPAVRRRRSLHLVDYGQ